MARGSATDDPLVLMMLVVLTGGFALFAFPDLLKGFGGGGCDQSKKFIAAYIGSYVMNHLNKAAPSGVTSVLLANTLLKGYPSAMTSMANAIECDVALPSANVSFYKTMASMMLLIAPRIGPGYNLSSGTLSNIKLMAQDGKNSHLSSYTQAYPTRSYPGISEFELEKIARENGYNYSQVMSEYGRSFAGIAEDTDIVRKVANPEDYTTIPRGVEAL